MLDLTKVESNYSQCLSIQIKLLRGKYNRSDSLSLTNLNFKFRMLKLNSLFSFKVFDNLIRQICL
jgi:hypothetical protein